MNKIKCKFFTQVTFSTHRFDILILFGEMAPNPTPYVKFVKSHNLAQIGPVHLKTHWPKAHEHICNDKTV